MKQFFGNKSRNALTMVLIVSFILHVIVLFIFGTIKLVTEFVREEKVFEAEVIEQPEQIEQEYTVNLQQRNQSSQPPRPNPIVVQSPQEINVPSIDINLNIDTGIAYGRGRGGSGFGGRDGGIREMNLELSQVDFFGLKSRGEKIVFVVDASRYALEDKKGGIPAYRLIKQELNRMISELKGSTLFNVLFYDSKKVYTYKPTLVPGINTYKEGLNAWMDDIHKDNYSNFPNNFTINNKIEPMQNRSSYFARGAQAAIEMDADAVFVLVAQYPHFGRFDNDEERDAFRRKNGFGDKEKAEWDKAVKEAEAWLAKENAERAKRGQPPRITHWIGTIVREMGFKGMNPPSDAFSVEEVSEHVQNAFKAAQPDAKARTQVNIVYFKAKGENSEHQETQLEEFAKNNRGKFEIIDGMQALQSIAAKNTPNP